MAAGGGGAAGPVWGGGPPRLVGSLRAGGGGKIVVETGGSAVKTVSVDQVGREELALPPGVQEALGELVGSAKEGLLALSVGVGLGVLAELIEEEVVEVVGVKGKHDPERVAVRHGHESGEVTLGGRRVPVARPRVRSAEGEHEIALAT